MNFWIIVIGLIVLIGIFKGSYKFIAGWIIAITLLACFTFNMWGYDYKESEKYYEDVYEIYSLNLQTQVSGNFVLGCGSVESEDYYTFYIKNNDNDYKLSKVKTNRTAIRMDSTVQPKLVKQVYKITKTPCTMFGGEKTEEINDTYRYLLIVPNNTIRQEYKVN